MKTAEEVVCAYENLLYRTALAITGNREDAEDLVQETFLRWLTKRPAFTSDEHEKAWLLRVIINLSRSLMKSAAHRTRAELLDIYPAKDEAQNELMEDILKLPPKYRAVIHLFYYEGYSTAETAQILGMKDGTVRSLLSRARSRLKAVWKDDI